MKKEGSLKSILAILVIILICVVSLGGIYVKDKNFMKNILPDYVLGQDLNGSIIMKLDVNKPEESSEATEENAENVEEDAEQAESEEASENNNSENKENKDNKENGQAEDIYNAKNYKKSKSIIEKRFKVAGIEQYEVRLDEQSGSIVVEVPKNIDSSVLQSIYQTGKTEIKITETNEVIADKNNIKEFATSIDDTYASVGVGSNVKIDIKFNQDAVKKFKELKNNYTPGTNESGIVTENNVSILVDGNSIVSLTETEFLQSAVNGSVQLYGNYTTDFKTLTSSLNGINSIKMLVETDDLPVTYTRSYQSDVINSNVNKYGIISVFAIVLIAMLVYLLYKFKLKGLLAEINIIGFASLLLLIIRFTKVEISIASLVAIGGMLALQFIYLIKLLGNEKVISKVFNSETLEFSKTLIPLLILSVFTALIPALESSKIIPFGNIQGMANFGMVGFWGLIVFEIFNNVITRAMFTNAKK